MTMLLAFVSTIQSLLLKSILPLMKQIHCETGHHVLQAAASHKALGCIKEPQVTDPYRLTSCKNICDDQWFIKLPKHTFLRVHF